MADVANFGSHIIENGQDLLLNKDNHSLLLLRKQRLNSIERLRSTYRTAARFFLHKEHLPVWFAVSSGLRTILSLSSARNTQYYLPWWINREVDYLHGQYDLVGQEGDFEIDQEINELERKFQILRITYLASTYTVSVDLLSLTDDPELLHGTHQSSDLESLRKLLKLTPTNLASTIWAMTTSINQVHLVDQIEIKSEQPPLASPELINIHPSIVTAAALASIKLGVPQIGKQICEAWLGSLNDQLLNHLEQVINSNISPQLSNSQVTIFAVGGHTNELRSKRSTADTRYSYERLVEVYTVHILASLDEWDFASDFVKAQNRDVGGILPPSTVQHILQALNSRQVQQARTANLVVQKQLKRLEQEQSAKTSTLSPGHHVQPSRDTNSWPSSPTESSGSERQHQQINTYESRNHIKQKTNSQQDERHQSEVRYSQTTVPSEPSTNCDILDRDSVQRRPSQTPVRRQVGFSSLRENLSQFLSADTNANVLRTDSEISLMRVLKLNLQAIYRQFVGGLLGSGGNGGQDWKVQDPIKLIGLMVLMIGVIKSLRNRLWVGSYDLDLKDQVRSGRIKRVILHIWMKVMEAVRMGVQINPP